MYIPRLNKQFFEFKKTLDDLQKQVLENMNRGAENVLSSEDVKQNKFQLDTLRR